MTNEMPKEAGEFWLARYKEDGAILVGESCISPRRGLAFSTMVDEYIYQHEWKDYDWHRIELPEGWKV